MKVKRAVPWILLGAAVLAVGCAVLVSATVQGVGYPLDDAWIHQTFARNLALRGEWAFIPGQPAAGSTSPLYTALLVIGHFIDQPVAWSFLLGVLALWGLAWTGEDLARAMRPDWKPRLPWVGLFLVFEWHDVWASASGMETILYAFLILLVLRLLINPAPAWWAIGLVAGAALWTRPDGLTLLGPVILVVLLQKHPVKYKIGAVLQFLGCWAALVLPYLLFNRMISGNWWPNTFYAKQAEYAIRLQVPFITRFLSLAMLPLVGSGVLLLPGLITGMWGWLRQRAWVPIAGFLWWLGITLVYALRLPLNYQHGRYLMPAMPVFFVLGIAGTAWMIQAISRDGLIQRLLWKTLVAAIGAVTVGFFSIGVWTYAQDVALINTEMVAAARWVAQNTDPDALVAVHDIGAMGYFGQHRLLDLAGLVSPEVIPFMRDEARLAQYLDENSVDYLVTFPGWYPRLTSGLVPVYFTGGTVSPAAGGENMTVYLWRRVQ